MNAHATKPGVVPTPKKQVFIERYQLSEPLGVLKLDAAMNIASDCETYIRLNALTVDCR
jgi:hypothetical protein